MMRGSPRRCGASRQEGRLYPRETRVARTRRACVACPQATTICLRIALWRSSRHLTAFLFSSSPCQDGRCALHYAIEMGDPHFVERLINAGADDRPWVRIFSAPTPPPCICGMRCQARRARVRTVDKYNLLVWQQENTALTLAVDTRNAALLRVVASAMMPGPRSDRSALCSPDTAVEVSGSSAYICIWVDLVLPGSPRIPLKAS